MALKNAYSKMPITNIFNDLQKVLVAHGARQIFFDYDEGGKCVGLAFSIPFKGQILPIKLPANIEKAQKLLNEQGFKYDRDQSYRVAWRNILDWVVAQIAFIEIGQVTIEQVFLPYVVDNQGVTLFEKLQTAGFLLGTGKE